MSLNTCSDWLNKGTVIIYQVEGLENFKGGKQKLTLVLWRSIFKTTQLRGVNLSLKHLVVKKKVKVKKTNKINE